MSTTRPPSRRPAAPIAAILVVVLAWSIATSAEPLGTGPVRSFMLDEATEIALVEDHRAPLVGIRIVFPAGSWSPWVRRTGAEEAFEIQLHDSEGSLRARADRLAAGIGLTVGVRTSAVTGSCLTADLPELIRLVKDVLSNRDFDRHELRRWNREKKISWDASQKEPNFRLAQASFRSVFEQDDPRRVPWEKPPALETDPAKLAEARDTLIRLPGRIVAFFGDLTREEAERWARDLLPAAAESPPEDLAIDFRPLIPADRRPRELSVDVPRLTQVYFDYGRDSLLYTSEDYPAFLVADHVLGGHFYSRLYVALRHEGGETYGAGTDDYEDVVQGQYSLNTFTRAPNAAATEAKLREVLRVFHEQGITEKERADAVAYLKGSRPFARQSPGQVLGRWLRERVLGLPPGFIDDLVDRAAQVSLDDINRLIARHHDPAAFTMIRVGTFRKSR